MPDPEHSILPYLTEDLPGIGGDLKTTMEDFIVDEIPVYAPSGEGDHLFLLVEKRDVSAQFLVKILSQLLRLNPRDIGVAGMKDRRAVTRQLVSVPAECEPLLADFNFDGIKILESTRHERKLKTGHLKGNQFSILIRNTAEDGFQKAVAIQEKIEQSGFPNYYGTQRMGRDNETVIMGLKLLKDERVPSKYSRNKSLKRLALSAAQSSLFNRVLTERVSDHSLHTVQLGDVMQVCETGGIFVVEDVPSEQERFNNRETVITGPIFGPKMKPPTDTVLEHEQRVLSEFSLDMSHFSRFKKLTPGARRPFIIWPDQLRIEETESGILFHFNLPSGVYATMLLREFMKHESVAPTPDDAQ
ncbi:tRNA pseudouridine(13) synthase TruD [uncultured Gimesia sp.]|uniref:tRNA pseudouridine(13) synthase TruD n=1 Tax=uncultured Gimesia sp. TaxID=1678688 RepID=UPI0030DBD544|tara:strand:+ start:6513 stop:7586 length:1074 start_codon:yes stop_codon:yes gene_type:complete